MGIIVGDGIIIEKIVKIYLYDNKKVFEQKVIDVVYCIIYKYKVDCVYKYNILFFLIFNMANLEK